MRTPFGNAFAQTQLAATKLDTGDATWLGNIGTLFRARRQCALGLDGDRRARRVANQLVRSARGARLLQLLADSQPSDGLRRSIGRAGLVAQPRGFRALQHRGWPVLPQGRAPVPAVRLASSGRGRVRAHRIRRRHESDRTPASKSAGTAVAIAVQFAVSNGTFGGSEVDRRKQFSLQTEYVTDAWRLGVAGNLNDAAQGDRSVWGVFAGLRTGPVSWLVGARLDRGPVVHPDRWPGETIVGLAGGGQLAHRARPQPEAHAPSTWIPISRLRTTARPATARSTNTRRSNTCSCEVGCGNTTGRRSSRQQNRRLYFLEMHGFF